MKIKTVMGTVMCFSMLSMQGIEVYALAQEKDIVDGIGKLNKVDIRYALENNVPIKKTNIDISDELGSLSKNEQVEVIEVIGEWVKIDYKNQIGYVKNKYLKSVNALGVTMYIDNADVVNVYEGAHIKSKQIGRLQMYDPVECLEDVGEFYRIKYKGKEAYIKKQEDILVKEVKRIVNGVALLKGGNSKSRDNVILKDGSEVVVLENRDKYVKVKSSFGNGYILKEKLVDVKYVNKEDMECLYDSVGNSSLIKTYIPNGAKVGVKGYIGEYAEVFYGEYRGYIKKDSLDKKKINIDKEFKYGEYAVIGKFEIDELLEKIDGIVKEELLNEESKDSGMTEKEAFEKNKQRIMSSVLNRIDKEIGVSKINKDTSIQVIANRGMYYEVNIGGQIYFISNDGDESYIQSEPTYKTSSNTRYVKERKAMVYKVPVDTDKELNESELVGLGCLVKDSNVEYVKELNERYSIVKVNGLECVMRTRELGIEKIYTKVSKDIRYVENNVSHKAYVESQVNKLNMVSSKSGMVRATGEDIAYYSNPNNLNVLDEKSKYQYLKLDKYRNINVYKLNEYLNNLSVKAGKKAIFANKGDVFVDAARKYDIDPTYLVAHMLLETGFGTSKLAQGVNYKGLGIVYNFFGIGAVDSDPINGACKIALKNGWTSVDKAIEGAAKWLSDNYIHDKDRNQNTLYKMRFNALSRTHQYATDVGWAYKISKFMSELSYMYEDSTLEFEVPKYKKGTYITGVNIIEHEEVEVEKDVEEEKPPIIEKPEEDSPIVDKPQLDPPVVDEPEVDENPPTEDTGNNVEDTDAPEDDGSQELESTEAEI